MTNIVKDVFILQTEDMHTKNNNWSWKSTDTAKTSSNFEPVQNINPR